MIVPSSSIFDVPFAVSTAWGTMSDSTGVSECNGKLMNISEHLESMHYSSDAREITEGLTNLAIGFT
jgi:hypothetical protein